MGFGKKGGSAVRNVGLTGGEWGLTGGEWV